MYVFYNQKEHVCRRETPNLEHQVLIPNSWKIWNRHENHQTKRSIEQKLKLQTAVVKRWTVILKTVEPARRIHDINYKIEPTLQTVIVERWKTMETSKSKTTKTKQ